MWCPPGKVRYTKQRIIWLLENYALISEVAWPPQPTGYTDDKGSRKRQRPSNRASFEAIIEVRVELEERMRRVGPDAALLRDLYCLGLPLDKVAFLWGISEHTVRSRRDHAVYLMSRKLEGVQWIRRRFTRST